MDDIRRRLEQILESLEISYDNYKKQLAQMPEGRLYREMRDGQPYYLQAVSLGKSIRRRGIMKDPQLIRQLAQKKCFELSGMHLEHNIRILSDVIAGLENWDPACVLHELPAAYGDFTEEDLFRPADRGGKKRSEPKEGIESLLERARRESGEERRIRLVREAQEIWEALPFEQSTKALHKKTHRTTRGLKVRSKSEAAVAEICYRFGIPFRYEQILRIGEHRFAPDFTFLDIFGRLHFWEHSGWTQDQGYLDRRRWKLSAYEQAGIVPWKNFIETFDDEDGNADLEVVINEVKGKLMKRLYLI